MDRTLIVNVPNLTKTHQAAILTAAGMHGFQTHFLSGAGQSPDLLRQAEIIFGSSPDLAKGAPRLRWQCTPTAGINQFTAPGAFPKEGAMLSNSSGAYGVTIAEHIVMVTLDMLRRQQEYAGIVSRRGWTRNLPIRSIKDSRVTMLGTGDIGREAARRIRAFGPEWIAGVNRSSSNPDKLFDRIIGLHELNAILPQTDLLIMSLPGTDETNRLLNAERLFLLPQGSLIVNVGRGSAIDQRALAGFLKEGRLRAALDVFEHEPLPEDDDLWTSPNLLITPHIAGNTTLPYTLDSIVRLFIEDFDNYCGGRPLRRQVDLTQGY